MIDPAVLQQQADDWNSKHPPGSLVIRYRRVYPLREPTITITKSNAWVMGGHSVMVMVDGVPGGVLLESVVPTGIEQPTEHPLLMRGNMVRAIKEGRKFVTRRVVKPQPIVALHIGKVPQFCCTGFGKKPYSPGYSPEELVQFCKHGRVGDRLWVRETWRAAPGSLETHYRADLDEASGGPWRPSIYLPRSRSRLTLVITDIRIERLQDITDEDILAEGLTEGDGIFAGSLRRAWIDGWDSINGKKYPWDSNPWVWRIAFLPLEVNDGRSAQSS